MTISELSRAAAAALVGCAAVACSVWVETPGDTPAASEDAGSEAPGPLDLAGYDLVDLSHAFGDETVYWPTDTAGFELQELAFGETEGGYFYSAYSLATAEHGGTHIDAPHPFPRGRARCRVDPAQAAHRPGGGDRCDRPGGRGRRLPADRRRCGGARGGARSDRARGASSSSGRGGARAGPDALSYLGDDTPGDASQLHFPSYGEAAARLLVEERGAAALGADVASIDYGPSTDFIVHQIVAAANAPGLENLTNLDRLPARGATVIALPMKISGGSGGPLRAIALVPPAN